MINIFISTLEVPFSCSLKTVLATIKRNTLDKMSENMSENPSADLQSDPWGGGFTPKGGRFATLWEGATPPPGGGCFATSLLCPNRPEKGNHLASLGG